MPGDEILISRGIGSGVIFAAAMQGVVPARYVDSALFNLSKSQHVHVEYLHKKSENILNLGLIHACTDVTGFGLLGHLVEMIKASNSKRSKLDLSLIKIKLFGTSCCITKVPFKFQGV